MGLLAVTRAYPYLYLGNPWALFRSDHKCGQYNGLEGLFTVPCTHDYPHRPKKHEILYDSVLSQLLSLPTTRDFERDHNELNLTYDCHAVGASSSPARSSMLGYWTAVKACSCTFF